MQWSDLKSSFFSSGYTTCSFSSSITAMGDVTYSVSIPKASVCNQRWQIVKIFVLFYAQLTFLDSQYWLGIAYRFSVPEYMFSRNLNNEGYDFFSQTLYNEKVEVIPKKPSPTFD